MRFAPLAIGLFILLSGCLEWTDSDRAILKAVGIDVPAENDSGPINPANNPPAAPPKQITTINNSSILPSISPPAFLHRSTLNCSTNLTTYPETKKDLSDGYSNYDCESGYVWQCINDGTFDSYYVEWCEDKYGRKVDRHGRVLK